MLKRIFLGIAVAVVLTGAAMAGPFEDGLAAFQRGDYATALRLLQPLAAQGNADAQFKLGVMYDNGRGVAQNYAEAMKWYRLAAAQGDAAAQNNLGLMYGTGRGVAQNYVQAHMWSNLAAAQGNENGRKNRDLAASKMTSAQIAEAQKLAAEWKPTPGR